MIHKKLGVDISTIDRHAQRRKKVQKDRTSKKNFENFIKALKSTPVFRNVDFSRRFYIQHNTSEYGVGAVLYQLNDNKEEHSIAFYSQKLNSCQHNYSVKECLAAVMAINKFRPYVEMIPFTVITDHVRWSLRLQSYDMQI